LRAGKKKKRSWAKSGLEKINRCALGGHNGVLSNAGHMLQTKGRKKKDQEEKKRGKNLERHQAGKPTVAGKKKGLHKEPKREILGKTNRPVW